MGSKKKKQKTPPKQEAPEEKEDVNYGVSADAYAADDSSVVEENTDDEEETSLEVEKEENSSASASSSEDEDGDEDEDEEEQEEVANNEPTITLAEGEEPCSFDLRNMAAVNSHPLHEPSLFKSKKFKDDEKLTIDARGPTLNEDYLLTKATEGCTQLIAALWQLPTQRSDAGPMVTLPSYDKIPIPRALPPPPPKVETRWEKFAKERGIPLNKEKRSRKVWDEATNSWRFRHGYDKANSDTARYAPIMEVGENDDPYADPWEKQRDEKFKKTEANRQNQMKNQERAGVLAKGTTRRVVQSREKARQSGKEGGRLDNQLPSGVPVDVNGKILRGKASTIAALKATQISTASLGKFDKLREGEPERKLVSSKKKRKMIADSNTTSSGEQERAAKVLKNVLQGGGVEKEKAMKKGKLAKGVTAYDYEYDDGHDKSLFQKKKGRGGTGKNKKMTKKRMK